MIRVANDPKHKLHTMFHELKSITEGNGFWRCFKFALSVEKKPKFRFRVVTIIDNKNVAYNKYNQTVPQYHVNRESSAQTVNVRPWSSLISLVPLSHPST